MEKIDFVVLWVDDTDPVWQQEKNKYARREEDKAVNRFRDWNTLRFWFRGVEKYAPWVNRVHFVTCGHLPKWLNTECDKLHIVKHSDFIPEEYLPTFSSHTIELNLHRIEGLASHFVYFNDDTFLINPVGVEDFFKKDLPCDMAALYPLCAWEGNFSHVMLNDAQFFSRNFDYRKVLKEHKLKWFYPPYGKTILKTLVMLLFPDLSGLMMHHQPQSYLKSTLEEVWEQETELLDKTCRNKFRDASDVNQFVFRYWQIGRGMFSPHNLLKRGEYVEIGEKSLDYERILNTGKKKLLCLNDSGVGADFNDEKEKLYYAFERKLPEKSQFEC